MKEKAIHKYGLEQIETVYEYKTRAVYFAVSKDYGNVVLKLNLNAKELQNEYETLQKLAKEYVCSVYDIDGNFLLEERVEPGRTLGEEAILESRLEKFVEVFSNLHHNTDKGFDTYLDWLHNAYLYCEKEDAHLKELMGKALEIGKELFAKYEDRVLLHGDLHHDNLLLNQNGSYTVIDPKGVIGPEIFDLPRFIMNEMRFCPDKKTGVAHIGKVIRILADKLEYSETDINKLFFMEVILANVWCLEDEEETDNTILEIAQVMLGNSYEEEIKGK